MARRYRSEMVNLSGGLKSGLSEYGRRPEHFTIAENTEFRPYGSTQVRKGTQRACSATLAKEPHTLMEWVGTGGSANKYVACKDAVNGVLYKFTGSAFTAQTTPHSLAAAAWLSWTQLNGAIFATEQAGANEPMFYRSSNTANTWLSMTFPTPGNTLTLTGGGGGSLTAGVTYYYRLRWVYTDGVSQASTPQSIAMGANTKVTVTTIPLGSARTDYLNWILERTDALGGATGPFYFVASGTANNYVDTLADGDLDYASDDVISKGIPNGHVDGLLALNDRLLAWQGSTAYLSQPIAGPQSTGINNWDAENAYDFGPLDGDTISVCLKQQDRVLVIKQNSVWALEGNDPLNYRVVHLQSGIGAAGLRSADCIGNVGWFHGSAGLHIINGNSIKPFGYIEVGDVIAKFSKPRYADMVIRGHLGQRVLFAYSDDAVRNDNKLVYDQRFGTWSVWPSLYAADILMPRAHDFGDAESYLFADPRNRGSGGSPDYRIWIGYYGAKDEKAADGTGGSAIPWRVRTPWIDDGTPDVEKRFDRLALFAQGSGATLSYTIEVDPGQDSVSGGMKLPSTAALWNAFSWGDGTLWGQSSIDSAKETGLFQGLLGRRYRLTVYASVTADLTYKGHVLDAIVQPQRPYSRMGG